jgi:NADPH-dependent 2,4-dienoyl-CoA reductase/sulfur reductase-like enzyme
LRLQLEPIDAAQAGACALGMLRLIAIRRAVSNPTRWQSLTELPMSAPPLPVVIIGAGPLGLAAAAHLLARSLTPVVFEAGAPTGRELVERYFESLAGTPELSPHVRFENRVVAVSRLDHDLMQDDGRDAALPVATNRRARSNSPAFGRPVFS